MKWTVEDEEWEKWAEWKWGGQQCKVGDDVHDWVGPCKLGGPSL